MDCIYCHLEAMLYDYIRVNSLNMAWSFKRRWNAIGKSFSGMAGDEERSLREMEMKCVRWVGWMQLSIASYCQKCRFIGVQMTTAACGIATSGVGHEPPGHKPPGRKSPSPFRLRKTIFLPLACPLTDAYVHIGIRSNPAMS